MQGSPFRKTPLASAIAVALGIASISPAVAQEEVIEEVVVTGIRSSLVSSMETKRSAKGVVDAITAEDIGKFPDTNLAESLQRIPGVSIDRANNEGSKVTVRGFGPEFNLVLLNGRQMPTAQLTGDNTRSFDFANLASEGVRGVNVYKTFNATKPSGGIGSTIDIVTHRPFDNPGLVASFGVKAMSDTTNEAGDDFTPEFSGLYSQTFADDKFGIGVFFSAQERDSRATSVNVAEQFWRENLPQAPSAVIVDNRASPDVNTFFPRAFGLNVTDASRKRTNGQLTMQFAPTDTFEATLDYTYWEYDNDARSVGSGIWFNDFDAFAGEIDQNGTYVFVDAAPGDYAATVALQSAANKSGSVGLNLDWQVNDDLTLALDVHDSDAESAGKGRGNGTFMVMAANCLATKSTDSRNTQDIPDTFVTWDACVGSAPGEEPTAAAYDSLFAQAASDVNESDITQIQLDGEWINASGDEGLTSIQFGVSNTDIDYRVRNFNSGQIGAGWYGGNQDVYDDSIFTRVDTTGIMSEFSGYNTNAEFYYDWDFEQGITAFENAFNGGQRLEADTSGTPLFDHAINEETIAAYAQFNVYSEFNGFPVSLVGGIRYESTDVTANSLQVEVEEVVWINPGEWSVNRAADQTISDVTGDYDIWLPNLDLSVDVRDDMIARFSYSKSITRPTLTDMRGTTSTSDRPKPGQRDGNQGNPALTPFTSDNFDLSFEWYYDDASYAAIGFFHKQVENFIVTKQIDTQVGNLRDPLTGPRAMQAIADIAAAGGDPADLALIHDQININAGQPVGTPIVQQDDDPLIDWRITQPANLEVANIYGWEFAIQHLFGDSGFGVSANATLVEGDIDVDVSQVGFQFVLPGLSDSANLVAFYENDRWSTRVAYNWRDEFLNGTRNNSPQFTEAYGQWDVNASFFVTESLNVFVEALNITDESQRIYNRYSNQFTDAYQFGARYNIGARYTFR